MKKKALLLASMGVLACTVGVTALAVGGANQLDRLLQVKADDPIEPIEYSITFDASDESTTVECKEYDSNYAICTTTDNGNKVGVVGFDKFQNYLSFRGKNFLELQLSDISNALVNAGGAREFSHITGYAISFEGGSLLFRTGLEDEGGSPVANGTPRTGLSINPSDNPRFVMDEYSFSLYVVTISSLTIWYSCVNL